MAAVGAAVVLAIVFIPRIIATLTDSLNNTSEDEIGFEEADISELKHMSFQVPSIDVIEGRLSVAEFSEALEQLYRANYVLVDIYDIVNISEEGSISYKSTVTVPEGKTPLLLTFADMSFSFDSQAQGTANRLVLDGGSVKAQYTSADGQTVTGDYDPVSILETFIDRYPEFSYDGARAVLALSGYSGVLGYRTTSYLAGEENNPYVGYGIFDTASESTSAGEVIEELKERGYHFASYGFADDISYGAEYSIVEADAAQWQEEVASLTGESDIILLPRQTDIDSWSGYSRDNPKYELLSGNGFRFYMVGNNATPYLMQVEDGYVRMTVYEIFSYVDFANALSAGS